MTQKSSYEQHEEFINRSRKLAEIYELGVEPYPHYFRPSHNTEELHKHYDEADIGNSEEAANNSDQMMGIAGRLVLFRAMGKNAFGHIQDSSGRLQVMFNRDRTEVVGYAPTTSEAPKPLKFIEKKIDLGDILGIEGHLFHTQKGEVFVHRSF